MQGGCRGRHVLLSEEDVDVMRGYRAASCVDRTPAGHRERDVLLSQRRYHPGERPEQCLFIHGGRRLPADPPAQSWTCAASSCEF
ncbi:Uncharacterised protein [Mycobacteroides abscessus subsp. abscessus]|nr:Uncharacterised protein [Mycobacteroides abscessus subsp. abscessus]